MVCKGLEVVLKMGDFEMGEAFRGKTQGKFVRQLLYGSPGSAKSLRRGQMGMIPVETWRGASSECDCPMVVALLWTRNSVVFRNN
jgi:hypothetical protein